MSATCLRSLTNGTLVPWTSCIFEADSSRVHPTWADPFPCPTCPDHTIHAYTFVRGERYSRSQEWVPASLLCEGTPGNGVVQPLVLIPGPGASTAAQVATRCESASFPSQDSSQCSAERLAIAVKDALADVGCHNTLVDGPTYLTFADKQGSSWAFFPRRYRVKSGCMTTDTGSDVIVTTLSGSLVPATCLHATAVAGDLHMYQTEEGGHSTLMSFDFWPPGSMEPIEIPPHRSIN